MNIIRIYRLLMVFIILMLIVSGSIMAYEKYKSAPETRSGKILVSRWYIL